MYKSLVLTEMESEKDDADNRHVGESKNTFEIECNPFFGPKSLKFSISHSIFGSGGGTLDQHCHGQGSGLLSIECATSH
jgi:hypothetical protein